jgi:uncharacterized repeat protein (TIGR03803 family)
MNHISGWKTGSVLILFFAMVVIAAPAQTVTTVANFQVGSGGNKPMALVQGRDGNFYGITEGAFMGFNGCGTVVNADCGTVFKISPGGTLTTIYRFCALAHCADGSNPFAGLAMGLDGNFYGTTFYGGANNSAADCSGGGCGTVFKITPGGKLTTLYNFCAEANCKDGAEPQARLFLGDGGNFWGTTNGEGSTAGTVFSITPAGVLATVYEFCSLNDCTDGSDPVAGLIQGTDGNFYGTTFGGGSFDPAEGTVFRITPAGTLTTLRSFSSSSPSGENPLAELVQGVDGFLYGTTGSGGSGTSDPFCTSSGCGTVFKLTTSGKFTIVHNFAGPPNDGWEPSTELIQGTDGNFYGTTARGGSQDDGLVFRMTPSGRVTTLHSFCAQTNCPDGSAPAGLVQGTNGKIYGVTQTGGSVGMGTVFTLDVGFSPFVEARPGSGKVGTNITILGNGLTGSTAVSFNSTAAAFAVVSDSEITATVPAGATTGAINVTTLGGPLASNVAFKVVLQVLSFLPTSGPASTSVVITGESLTGASAVSFGSVLATSFTVNSDTQITATVPTGAATGDVAVRTAGGRGQSATAFTVTP